MHTQQPVIKIIKSIIEGLPYRIHYRHCLGPVMMRFRCYSRLSLPSNLIKWSVTSSQCYCLTQAGLRSTYPANCECMMTHVLFRNETMPQSATRFLSDPAFKSLAVFVCVLSSTHVLEQNFKRCTLSLARKRL